MPPIQEIQAVKQQHEKRVSLALSVLSDSETWNFNTNNDPSKLQLHDYGDSNNNNNDEFNTSLTNNDFNTSQHSLNLHQHQQHQQQQQHDLNLRADYDAAIKCIHLCESIINTLQSQNSHHEQTIDQLQLQTNQLMHSLQMAELEKEEELNRVQLEKEECEERLVEMSLELARAKSFEDEYYLVRRRLDEVESVEIVGGGEEFDAEKMKKKTRQDDDDETLANTNTTSENRRPSYIAQEVAALRLSYLALPKNNNSDDDDEGPVSPRSSYLGMGFGWPQDHVNFNNSHDNDGGCDHNDGEETSQAPSIEPYSPSTRRLSCSSLVDVSIPQEEEEEEGDTPTHTYSTKKCSTPAKNIESNSQCCATDKIDHDERCTSDTAMDNKLPQQQQQPSISSSLWNQVETFTKTARRSKLSSAAESALFGSFTTATASSSSHKDSPAYGFGWPEKDNEDGCLSVIAPTVPSTALSSSFVSSSSNGDGLLLPEDRARSSSNSSSLGRMASNITTSSGTSFVKGVVDGFLVNLKEEAVR